MCEKSLAIYTDASFYNKVMGYSFLYYEINGSSPKEIYYGKQYIKDSATAELVAIRKAIEYVLFIHEEILSIEVRCDNQRVINDFKISKSLGYKIINYKETHYIKHLEYIKELVDLINLFKSKSKIKISLKKVHKASSRYHRLVDKTAKIIRKDEKYQYAQLYCGTFANQRKICREYEKEINFVSNIDL